MHEKSLGSEAGKHHFAANVSANRFAFPSAASTHSPAAERKPGMEEELVVRFMSWRDNFHHCFDAYMQAEDARAAGELGVRAAVEEVHGTLGVVHRLRQPNNGGVPHQ